MYFVRLQGCDVGCYFCDTKYTWRDSKQTILEADIANRAMQSQAEWVCITGGEPYEQELSRLVDSLHDYGQKVHIETSGGAPWQEAGIDWVCLSPKDLFTKKEFQTHEEFKDYANEIKCVVTKPEDAEYYLDQYYQYCRRDKPLILQPVSNDVKLINPILKCIEGLTNARCMLQVHKFMELR